MKFTPLFSLPQNNNYNKASVSFGPPEVKVKVRAIFSQSQSIKRLVFLLLCLLYPISPLRSSLTTKLFSEGRKNAAKRSKQRDFLTPFVVQIPSAHSAFALHCFSLLTKTLLAFTAPTIKYTILTLICRKYRDK